jgi:hypothetical protein
MVRSAELPDRARASDSGALADGPSTASPPAPSTSQHVPCPDDAAIRGRGTHGHPARRPMSPPRPKIKITNTVRPMSHYADQAARMIRAKCSLNSRRFRTTDFP